MLRQRKVAPLLVIAGLMVGILTGSQINLSNADPPKAGVPASAPAIPRELTSYRDVVKKVLPAVVYIQAEPKNTKVRRSRVESDDSPLPQGDLRRFMEDMRRGEIPRGDQAGSGVIIDPKGIIVTNNHVVSGVESVSVKLVDGRKFSTSQIYTDPKTDLAVVKVETTGPLPFVEIGDSDEMEIGDRVLAVGAPFGLAGSVTHGIISAKGRSLNMNVYEDFIQTDAPINPGNSGGPIVSLEGKVVGISTAIKSQSGGFQGVGMAIPSNMVQAVVSQLANGGTVKRGYLGINMQDLSPDVARQLSLNEDQRGVVVLQVFSDAPASKAGVQEGDVITAINGRPVTDGRELQRGVLGMQIGKPAELSILRNGKASKVKVTIEQQPDDYGLVRSEAPRRQPRRGPDVSGDVINLDKLGVEVLDLTADLADRLGYKETKGALIRSVEEGSVAEYAGLGAGMLIVQAERKPVESAKDLQDIMSKASLEKGVLLLVKSPRGGTRYIVVKGTL